MEHGAADHALACSEKEYGSHENVCCCRVCEVSGGRIGVESESQDSKKAKPVGPDVDSFVVEVET